jgi:hypothetical protein
VLVGHLRHSLELEATLGTHGTQVALTIRDPVDVALSWVRFVRAWSRHPAHAESKRLSDDDLIGMRLDGRPDLGVRPLHAVVAEYSGWLGCARHVARFEELRDASSRIEALRALWTDLDVAHDQALLDRVAGQLVSRASPTYRPNTSTRAWEDLHESTRARMLDELSPARIVLGYQ